LETRSGIAEEHRHGAGVSEHTQRCAVRGCQPDVGKHRTGGDGGLENVDERGEVRTADLPINVHVSLSAIGGCVIEDDCGQRREVIRGHTAVAVHVAAKLRARAPRRCDRSHYRK
jgi:hypothetical protein